MPGFTTHYVLGMKAYNDMPQNNLKFIIAKYRWLYQLGLQGPDMFFYNLPILRHRDHRNVGSLCMNTMCNYFFRCCFLQLSRIGSRQQREEGLAYMCGFICHYIGDSICHPYVYGRIEYDVNHPGSITTDSTPNWRMTSTPFSSRSTRGKSHPSSTRQQPSV